MRASIIGSGFVIPSAGIESIKWLGLLCMVQEHVFRYVFGSFPLVVFIIGRMAFPLFAIAICRAVATDQASVVRTVTRLVLWGCIAEACRWLVLPVGSDFSVLFTFALGLMAYALLSLGVVGIAAAAGCLALSGFVEYGVLGVLFVMLLRDYFVSLRWSSFWLSVVCVCAASPSWFPALAFVAAPFAARFEIVRVPGFFYWSYAAQWPMFWGLRHAL